MASNSLPLFLDLTVLSDVRLAAASLYTAAAAGRPGVFVQDDLETLTYLPAGYVIEYTHGDEEMMIGEFMSREDRRLQEILPDNPRLDHPAAALVFLREAIRCGLIHRRTGYYREGELTELLSLSQEAMDSFRDWEDGLAEFLRQDWIGESDHAIGDQRRRLLGSDAWTSVSIPATVDEAYAELLAEIGRDHYASGRGHSPGFPINPIVHEPRYELAKRLRISLTQGLADTLDGSAENLSRSRTVRDTLQTLGHFGKVQSIGDRLARDSRLSRGFEQLSAGRRVADLIDLVGSASSLESAAELLAANDTSRASRVGPFLADSAIKSFPKPLNVIFGLGRLVMRRRRSKW